MKKFKITFVLILTIACLSILSLKPAIAEPSGCGECWEGNTKAVTFNLFGDNHTLCNCDIRTGHPRGSCVCKEDAL